MEDSRPLPPLPSSSPELLSSPHPPPASNRGRYRPPRAPTVHTASRRDGVPSFLPVSPVHIHAAQQRTPPGRGLAATQLSVLSPRTTTLNSFQMGHLIPVWDMPTGDTAVIPARAWGWAVDLGGEPVGAPGAGFPCTPRGTGKPVGRFPPFHDSDGRLQMPQVCNPHACTTPHVCARHTTTRVHIHTMPHACARMHAPQRVCAHTCTHTCSVLKETQQVPASPVPAPGGDRVPQVPADDCELCARRPQCSLERPWLWPALLVRTRVLERGL